MIARSKYDYEAINHGGESCGGSQVQEKLSKIEHEDI